MNEISRRRAIKAALAGTVGVAVSQLNLPATASVTAPRTLAGANHAVRASTTSDPSIVYQTSFEDSADTSWLTNATTYDTSQFHTGTQSLKYSRTVTTEYIVARHSVPFEVGGTYQVSAFVKTSNLTSPSPGYGAGIALEAFDANGKWIRGAYSVGTNSTEWELRTATYSDIPPGTADLVVSVYIYRGFTGTAWFDELRVAVPSAPVLTTQLNYPSYRGLVIPGDHPRVDLRINVNVDKVDAAAHQVQASILRQAGTVVDQQTFPTSASIPYTYPAANLPAGKLVLRTRLVEIASGVTVAEDSWDIEKLDTAPSWYIDSHGRFIRNGELFFPLGFYASDVAESVADMDGTPFNTILAYRPPTTAKLDLAASYNVNVIFAINSFYYDTEGAYYRPPELVTEEDEVPVIINTVNQYKDHPALLAWYMSDELQVDYFGPRMIKHQQAVAQTDNRHPTLTVNPLVEIPEVYMRCTDVLGVDNYPLYGKPNDDLAAPGRLARDAVEALPRRGMWHVAQSFDWTYYGRDGRSPTREELRSMCWQYVIEGATGLLLYQLPLMHRDPDVPFEVLMGDATAVADQIVSLLPVVLSIEPTPQVTSNAAATLNWTVRSRDNYDYVLAVSNVREGQNATFTAPTAMTVDVVGEGRSVPVSSDGSFTDNFAGLALHIYRMSPPSFASLADLTIAELDKYGASGGEAVGIACERLLAQAKQAESNDRGAAAQLVAAYRRLIGNQQGNTLSADQVANLLPLAAAL